ncbi:hypothetical protein PP556_14725 [Mycobacteroides abscessus]|nr:hypothetical protein [Mycobacteroides abscessus]MDM2451184.1 hypothetical protein [Mycobacteroides abscessus]MDM2455670.1 hypothetical protein [Mycobacteroides abscessus]MDM2460422.1 hypothetical protein [Mycobacteroides abscessus]MDM2466146.1 hypothetical protein [Mycobacteroides abscessus]
MSDIYVVLDGRRVVAVADRILQSAEVIRVNEAKRLTRFDSAQAERRAYARIEIVNTELHDEASQ